MEPQRIWSWNSDWPSLFSKYTRKKEEAEGLSRLKGNWNVPADDCLWTLFESCLNKQLLKDAYSIDSIYVPLDSIKKLLSNCMKSVTFIFFKFLSFRVVNSARTHSNIWLYIILLNYLFLVHRCPASLTYTESFRWLRDPVSNNKVDSTWEAEQQTGLSLFHCGGLNTGPFAC